MAKINLLCLVTPDIVDMVNSVSQLFENVIINIDTYHRPKDVIDLVQSNDFDVILLGGPLAYNILKDHIERKWIKVEAPILYVEYTEVSIYKALLYSVDLSSIAKGLRFSIDHPAESDIKECLKELEIRTEQIFSWECHYRDNLDEVVMFHYSLWKRGKIDFSMTSIYSVYERLRTLGAPIKRMVPAKSSIRNGIQRAILVHEAEVAGQGEVAVLQVIFEKINHGESSKGVHHLAHGTLRKLVNRFVDKIQGEAHWSEGQDSLHITCRKINIDRATKNFDEFDMGYIIYNKCGISSFWGVGYGRSINYAKKKAKQALSTSIKYGKSSCHVMGVDGNLIGPVGRWEKKDYAYRTDSEYIIDLSKKTGLGVGTINKIVSFSTRGEEFSFTANDISRRLQITTRSARRIISCLELAGCAVMIGQEQPIGKGRPRRVYSLRM
ncbi:hypothetical protein LY622_22095 [Halomonas sp. M5N1S17]|uniref:hypothetical protein n=1 Tax=Halomonas alkalisoli TaxID=2907158 RepID=UPI001F44CB40|nr:hypothetical protein [Halomonas alkalisoli]MCE9666126.1 hypothetical protein [Halomonas alkalisoli]